MDVQTYLKCFCIGYIQENLYDREAIQKYLLSMNILYWMYDFSLDNPSVLERKFGQSSQLIGNPRVTPGNMSSHKMRHAHNSFE